MSRRRVGQRRRCALCGEWRPSYRVLFIRDEWYCVEHTYAKAGSKGEHGTPGAWALPDDE